MNELASIPRAFILTGAFWVICRNPLYLTELKSRGITVLLITPERFREQAESARKDAGNIASFISDIAYVEGSIDKEASFNPGVIAAVRNWLNHYIVIGACAVGETLVEPTGILADGLDLPTPGIRATRVCRSKYLQRFYLSEWSPQSLIIPPDARARVNLEEHAYPAIMKPTTRHSSSGVVSVVCATQAASTLAEYPDYETILIEEQVFGPEYSVETLTQNRETVFSSVTKKITTDTYDNTFVELSHTVPYQGEGSDLLLNATREILETLDFSDGISHAEWRIRENRPYLMEVAARTPGDGLMILYQLACGNSMEPEIVKIALGEPAAFPQPVRVARQVYIPHEPGILRGVELSSQRVPVQWIAENETWPNVIPGNKDDAPTLRAVFVLKALGDVLTPLRSSDDRAVTFFIDAKTDAELDELERQICSEINIVVGSNHGN